MSGQRKCPDCGSLEIVEDSHYAQNQLVCADCGFILTEGLLTTTYADEEHLQEVAYSRSTGQSEQLTRSVQRGIRRVRDLCKVLWLPALFEDTAVSYYQQAISRPCFCLVSLERKELLVGCCVFVTCRQHSWPLTMGTVCLLLYANKELFASTYLRFLKELALDVPALSLIDLVKTHLNRPVCSFYVKVGPILSNFPALMQQCQQGMCQTLMGAFSSFKLFQSSPSLPTKFLEDKEQLVARTIQIVELASATWLVTGRHPIPIVTAAAYLAWQSLRPVGRLTCTLSQFCKAAGTDVPRPAYERLKELCNVLLQMSSQVAWLRVLKVDRRTVAKYVGDLLQHRRVLLQAAFRRVDAAEDGDPESSGHTTVLQVSQPPSPAAVEGASWAGEKRPCSSPQPLLLPPCVLNPRKKLRAPDQSPETSAITGDEPILDSEIEQYLRSPEEKELFSKAQACLRP